LIKSLEECKEQREDCEKRSDAQQEQIDALIDGDHALAKAKRGSDVFQSVKG
jgi:response regulator of citrate/malate metabolism